MPLPFELVLLVPHVIGLVVVEEVGDPRRQVAVDAVHVARRGHDGAHVLVAVLDALLHLNTRAHAHARTRRVNTAAQSTTVGFKLSRPFIHQRPPPAKSPDLLFFSVIKTAN